MRCTYGLIDPRHFDFDPNEAYAAENEMLPVEDGKMVHAENQDDLLMYAIHDQQPNASECQNDEILKRYKLQMELKTKQITI